MDEATKQWFDSEFKRIAAGRVPLFAAENVHYIYADPVCDSSESEEISSSVDASI
jgi:hypothetical protein